MTRLRQISLLFFLCSGAHAAEQVTPPGVGNLLQVLFGLVAVLAALGGIAWAMRRLGLAKPAVASTVKVVGGVSVGNRERILVVEVGDEWIVVGVAPGRVNALSTMPRQETPVVQEQKPDAKNFAAWLKQTIEKRNAQ